MRMIKKFVGRLIFGFAKVLSHTLDGLIYAIETGVLLAKSFLKGCAVLISMGGCLFILLMIGPLGTILLRNPIALPLLFLIMIFPVIGAISIVYLKYIKYITTKYLFHLAEHLMDSEKVQYRSFGEFKEDFRRAEEERIRREQERRRQQQRQWEERFRQWHQQSGGWQGTYQRGYSGGYGSQGGFGPTGGNPYEEFKKKYRESCEILGVSEEADQYRIKLAYRKKAKEFHPDVNKDPQATQKFQKINEAYEFLNEDNIQRYQRMQ